MPLINLNQKSDDSVSTGGAPTTPAQAVNQQTNSLGENMALKQSLSVNSQTTGVKEYSLPEQQIQKALPPIDPVVNLDQKIQNLNVVQNIKEPVQQSPQNTVPVSQQIVNQNNLNLAAISNATISFSEILDRAISEEASDIHLTVGYRPMLRVDGALKTLNAKELTAEDLFKHCSVVVEKRKDINLETLKQVDLGYSYKNRRFRINIFRTTGVLSLVARLVPSVIKSIDELELPQIIKQIANVPSGLVLLTGPTGSGKSTTLAAILNNINVSRAEHIVTLEDPIEFVFPKGQSLIDQRELGQDFDSWPDGLRAILRQDPNVVLVGEVRDFDTIASTITVSETGHLVFATLHTNSAAQTIDRIIDVFPENQQEQIRIQLAQVLTAVVAQRLVPLPGGGRKAVHEILIATPAVKNAIREGQTHQIDNMIQTGQDYGMMTMEKALVDLIRKGLISIDTAKEASIKPEQIDILLSQI